MSYPDLLGGPPPTQLPEPAEPTRLRAAGTDPVLLAARFPAFSAAWADLAEAQLAELGSGQPAAGGAPGGDATTLAPAVAAYAYARVGYHRGLDALRRAGWKGAGPVPWDHEGNRGYLRSVAALGRAAAAVGEAAEAHRCADLLRDGDPAAVDALGDPAAGLA